MLNVHLGGLAIILDSFFWATFNVMSPRHCGENEKKLSGLWAVDIHELLGILSILMPLLMLEFSGLGDSRSVQRCRKWHRRKK